VDAALCFWWIDGVRKRIDEHSYQIRFTPRKATSIWSRINIDRARILRREGKMREAGLKAYSHRREDESRIYPTSSRRPPYWSARMSCDLGNSNRRGNSSKRSRRATGSW
jgi:uncharacterized protein YdeI (YjbR/CyaY-like superfamily)